ncbi:haloacid dehalogenase type II [soil metagenome]
MELRALLFDVFGTVVDWRGSLLRDLGEFGRRRGIKADWAALADAWRAAYAPAMAKVITGEVVWTNLETLQRASLEALTHTQGIAGLTPADLDEINLLWRRGRPWPDSVNGLRRLKTGFIVAPLSNGNLALLIEMARRGKLPWDAVFSTEIFKSYKPHPSTYLGACDLLGLPPDEVMLCAAHNRDLEAAKALGLRTAFISRPLEYGKVRAARPTEDWDFSVGSLNELAERLGV